MVKQKNNNDSLWPSKYQLLSRAQLHKLADKLLSDYQSLLQAEEIPNNSVLTHLLTDLFIPMAAWLIRAEKMTPLVIGINGPQGSGKSTLCKILKMILEQGFEKSVVSLSIDDLYLTEAQRKKLADEIHPLFSTRGVPATHDVKMGISIIKQLMENGQSDCLIPEFNKSTDERSAESRWRRFTGNCDIILFEGWCVGTKAQQKKQLQIPVNQLEREEDPKGIWRNYINLKLQGEYSELFSYLDTLIMFTVPSFNKVLEWRKLQEEKLRKKSANNQNKTMNDNEVERFIMYFERLTRHTLNEMPGRCDIELQLGNDHQIKNVVTQLIKKYN